MKKSYIILLAINYILIDLIFFTNAHYLIYLLIVTSSLLNFLILRN